MKKNPPKKKIKELESELGSVIERLRPLFPLLDADLTRRQIKAIRVKHVLLKKKRR